MVLYFCFFLCSLHFRFRVFTVVKFVLLVWTELIPEKDPEVETNDSSAEFPVVIDLDRNENKSYKENITDSAKIARENQIISNFSRALWKVLKEYKNKLEVSLWLTIGICCLLC